MAFSLRNLVPALERPVVPPLQIVRQGGVEINASSQVVIALKFQNGEVSIHRAVPGTTEIFVHNLSPTTGTNSSDTVPRTVVLVPPPGLHYRDSSGVLIANLSGMTLYGTPAHQHTDAFLSEYFSTRDWPQLFTLLERNLPPRQITTPEPTSPSEEMSRMMDDLMGQRAQDQLLERANRLGQEAAEAAAQAQTQALRRILTIPTDFETLRQQMWPEGRSAYEIAVGNGFTGTSQEWLDSLQTRHVTPPVHEGGGIFFSGRPLAHDRTPQVGEIRSNLDAGGTLYIWTGERWEDFGRLQETPHITTQFHIPRINPESTFSVGGIETPTPRINVGRELHQALIDTTFDPVLLDDVTEEEREIAQSLLEVAGPIRIVDEIDAVSQEAAPRFFRETPSVQQGPLGPMVHTYTAQENIREGVAVIHAAHNLEQETMNDQNPFEVTEALPPNRSITFLNHVDRGRLLVQLPDGRTETLLTTGAQTVGGRPLELLDHFITQGLQGERGPAGAEGPMGPRGLPGPPGAVTSEVIAEFFRNRIQIRSRLDLVGTELSIKTSIVLTPSQSENEAPSNEDEQILSEDEDFVDISDILSQGNE